MLTGKIEFSSAQLYPEGIAYDTKSKKIFVSSLYTGKVGCVDDKGNFTTFCNDAKLISTVGMKYNATNNKLYVINTDGGMSLRTSPATLKKINQLVIIDVKSATIENVIELGGLYQGKHFVNDLTIDKNNNVYITDSYSPVIYKVDSKNNKSIFVTSDIFKPDSNAIGTNGIDWNADGYLLVAKTVEGSLWKVTMDGKVTQVQLTENVKWTDGILFTKKNELVVVQNRLGKTIFLQSDDNWKSAKLVREEKSNGTFPTTATQSEKNVYVINSRLGELREGKKEDDKFVIDVITK
jgi:sugar lactone lactonase YvrE